MKKRKNVAIIGSGISGLSIGNELLSTCNVTIFEKERTAGGLISCENINGIIYHKVGGHVFNTNNEKVANWFWKFFNKELDFTFAQRNAKIYIEDKMIGYPIENHLYELDPYFSLKVLEDILKNNKHQKKNNKTLEEFFISTFGETLFNYYFKPYNEKIWNIPLNIIPLEWLDGKLPMPKAIDILLENIFRKGESKMVHSQFYYPLNGGSQFIANKLAENLNINYSYSVNSINHYNNKFIINNQNEFDIIIYTGDVRELPNILRSELKINYFDVFNLKSNGTTNVLCEIDELPYSWVYLPEKTTLAHRIIMTGNFSPNNNGNLNRKTCTIEFAGIHDDNTILNQLKEMPFNIRPIKIHKEKNSYIIHEKNTRDVIQKIKNQLEPLNFFLLGRFAEWEYYNMDKAIESALLLKNKIETKL